VRGFNRWLQENPYRAGAVGASGAVLVFSANSIADSLLSVLALLVLLLVVEFTALYRFYLLKRKRSQ